MLLPNTKLKNQLALINTFSKVIIIILAIFVIPWLVKTVSIRETDDQLIKKLDQVYDLIETNGIEVFIDNDSNNQGFGSYNILKEIDFPWPVAKVVRQHHERLDGSGYPDGLKGDEILFEARILAVADVVEAMDSPRPYRSTLGILKALKEIDDNKGILYEEEIVRACVNLFKSKKFDYFM